MNTTHSNDPGEALSQKLFIMVILGCVGFVAATGLIMAFWPAK